MTFDIDTITLSDLAGEDIIDSRDLADLLDELNDLDDRTDEQDALRSALAQFRVETENYSGDSWEDGVTFIRDSYFEDYAQELADDIGAIDGDAAWPMNCIDWERAARELRTDYTCADLGDITFWYR